MSTDEIWPSLAARIHGLTASATLVSNLFDGMGGESMVVMCDLENHVRAIASDLLAFRNSSGNLPPAAGEAIARTKTKIDKQLENQAKSITATQQINIRTCLVLLAALEGEVSYILRDNDEIFRSRAERGFLHLSRSLMVDTNLRQTWVNAFHTEGEVECERLGAVHLLSHGIWAFKVNAQGGRTDLVFPEPPDLESVRRTGDGLVLTEWKKCNDGRKSAKAFEEARNQASRYSEGVLGGLQLKRHRYAVVISLNQVAIPRDIETDGTIYRHINIAVEPLTPSRQ